MEVNVPDCGRMIIPAIIEESMRPVEAALLRIVGVPITVRTAVVAAAGQLMADLMEKPHVYWRIEGLIPLGYSPECMAWAIDGQIRIASCRFGSHGSVVVVSGDGLQKIAHEMLAVELYGNVAIATAPTSVIVIECQEA